MRTLDDSIYCKERQHGLSLIELLVSIAIGVVLSFGAVNLFLQSKRSFLQDEQAARMLENGRYAQRYVARELSMSSFYGGILRGEDINVSLGTVSGCYEWMTTPTMGLQHFNNITSASDVPNSCLTGTDTPVVGTDVLVVRRVKDTRRRSRDEDDVLSGVAPASDVTYLQVEDYNVNVSLVYGGSVSVPSSGPYDYWEYYPQIIFLRDWSVTVGDGTPALCRKKIATGSQDMANTECLVEGVENFQVVFGIDSNGDYFPDRFVPASGGGVNAVSDLEMALALSAKSALLLRSVNELSGYSNGKAFTLGGESISASNDGFYRRVYETSTILRNTEALGI